MIFQHSTIGHFPTLCLISLDNWSDLCENFVMGYLWTRKSK